MHKVESPPQKKKKYIANQPVYKVTDRDQQNRKLDILLKKDLFQGAVDIPDIHINQRIETKDIPKKHIIKQSGKKTDDKPEALTVHKAKRRCYDDQQIRRYSAKGQCLKDSGLEYKTDKQHKCSKNIFFHCAVTSPE
jgi:hypothetical protein